MTDSELRRLFVAERIEQRHADGELTTKQVYYQHLDPPLEREPPCTHSVRLAYYTTNREKVAEVHYYERPDKSIAASGLLDPKEVIHQGKLYYYDRV